MEAFRTLGPGDQEVLMLTSWDGLNSTAAAKVLGCSRGAFAVRLHRARRRLVRAIEDRGLADPEPGAPPRPGTRRLSP